MYETLLIAHRDAIALLTLNRPQQLNAYTVQMGEELVHAFDALRADDGVRVLVLTGAGCAFCAGLDMKAATQTPDPRLPALGEQRLLRSFGAELFHYPKPVIAAINGATAGIGVTITLPCDVRYAAAGAKVAFAFAKLGIVPGLGSSHLLPRLPGPGEAKMLALTGRSILAEEALAIGLADRVVAPESLLAEALELAHAIAADAPETVGLIKETLNTGAGATSIEAALAFEHAQNARRSRSQS